MKKFISILLFLVAFIFTFALIGAAKPVFSNLSGLFSENAPLSARLYYLGQLMSFFVVVVGLFFLYRYSLKLWNSSRRK